MAKGTRATRDLEKYAASLGFELARDRKHLVFRLPDVPGQVVCSKTASDGRALKNAQADLRRFAGAATA